MADGTVKHSVARVAAEMAAMMGHGTASESAALSAGSTEWQTDRLSVGQKAG